MSEKGAENEQVTLMEQDTAGQISSENDPGDAESRSEITDLKRKREPEFSIEQISRTLDFVTSMPEHIKKNIIDSLLRGDADKHERIYLNKCSVVELEERFGLIIEPDFLDKSKNNWELENFRIPGISAPIDLRKRIQIIAVFHRTARNSEAVSPGPIVSILCDALWALHTYPQMPTINDGVRGTPIRLDEPLNGSGKQKRVGQISFNDMLELLKKVQDSDACLSVRDKLERYDQYSAIDDKYVARADYYISIDPSYFGEGSANVARGEPIVLLLVMTVEEGKELNEVIPALIGNMAIMRRRDKGVLHHGSDYAAYGAATDGYVWQFFKISEYCKVLKTRIYKISTSRAEFDKLFRAILGMLLRSLESNGRMREGLKLQDKPSSSENSDDPGADHVHDTPMKTS
ncbi:hypothetical protein ABW21_db0209454 [Orbilia brochopaga]|nr:hypothetical protein ABW21_db0209454 [Drechslerella brochopaga]